ncbi:RNA polymerase sigma factor [Streptosporangium sp. OZ121]|uniref:RNA polymerase sigma factor n=1 Tax=Streptosporangium sp. OZ121 TaxID=3444183 RepID=UPI003F7B1731
MLDTGGDSSLAERFRKGDPHALTEMYERFAAPMFATALNLLGDRELAADAVQLAFVQAWKAAGSFDAERELRPWLYAIVRRTAVDVYRRERRYTNTVPIDVLERETPVMSDTSMETAWNAWRVREALDSMSPEDRTVLYLAYFESLSQSEIAGCLAIPIGTVKSRTSRAHKRLASLLAPIFLTERKR